MSDAKNILANAEELLSQAAAATGIRATELREKGEAMLQQAKAAAQDLQETVVVKGKAAARATDDYVQENPWKAVGIAAGIGLVIGLLLNRDR